MKQSAKVSIATTAQQRVDYHNTTSPPQQRSNTTNDNKTLKTS
jgi:hypothetical protein